MKHKLNILPEYFKEVLNENKTFELRKDNIDYKIGDVIELFEFDGEVYTGQKCEKKISYILRNVDQYGLKEGFVILAIGNIMK
jgi:hypothetical protein